ncbi:MAG: hypothetical protein WCJ54_03485 [Actinomycetota bacterium]
MEREKIEDITKYRVKLTHSGAIVSDVTGIVLSDTMASFILNQFFM